jgi:hypothetical protein
MSTDAQQKEGTIESQVQSSVSSSPKAGESIALVE